MLERLLAHLRHAALLKEFAERGRHPAERRLVMVIASLHQARARKLMREVPQPLSRKSSAAVAPAGGREAGEPVGSVVGARPRHAPLGRSRPLIVGAGPRYR